MADRPIDLTAERNRRAAPDPEHVRQDDIGRPLYRFLCSYDLGRDRYGFEIWAYDQADAAAKLAAIRASAVLDGQLFTVVPG